MLASGVFHLPAASSFGTPGFHEVLTAATTLPDELGATEGWQLVVSLRDASRPGQTCGQDHPLSGCATVDWSDSQGRPNVPDSGVFENWLTIGAAANMQTHYLSESGALRDAPDSFSPG